MAVVYSMKGTSQSEFQIGKGGPKLAKVDLNLEIQTPGGQVVISDLGAESLTLDGYAIPSPENALSGQFLKFNGTELVWSAVTKTNIGLSNVDNTADIDKPISTAVQTALEGKASTSKATTTSDGLMSKEDKIKLNSLSLDGGGEGGSSGPVDPDERLIYVQTADGWAGFVYGSAFNVGYNYVTFGSEEEPEYDDISLFDPSRILYQPFTNHYSHPIVLTQIQINLNEAIGSEEYFEVGVSIHADFEGHPDLNFWKGWTPEFIIFGHRDYLALTDGEHPYIILDPDETIWVGLYYNYFGDDAETGYEINVLTDESSAYALHGGAEYYDEDLEMFIQSHVHVKYDFEAHVDVEVARAPTIIDEAPLGGRGYFRLNAYWEEMPVIPDFPDYSNYDGCVLYVHDGVLTWHYPMEDYDGVYYGLRRLNEWLDVAVDHKAYEFQINNSYQYYSDESEPKTDLQTGWYGTRYKIPGYRSSVVFSHASVLNVVNPNHYSYILGIWLDNDGVPGKCIASGSYDDSGTSRGSEIIELHLPYGEDQVYLDDDSYVWVGVVLGASYPPRFPESIGAYTNTSGLPGQVMYSTTYSHDFESNVPVLVEEPSSFTFMAWGHSVPLTIDGYEATRLVTDDPLGGELVARRGGEWSVLTPQNIHGYADIPWTAPETAYKLLATNRYDQSIWIDPASLLGETMWYEDVTGGVSASYTQIEIGKGLKGVNLEDPYDEDALDMLRLESRGITVWTSTDSYPSSMSGTKVGESLDLVFKPGNGVTINTSNNPGTDRSIAVTIGVRDASTTQSGLLSASDKAKLNGLNASSYATLSSNNTFTGEVHIPPTTSVSVNTMAARKDYVDSSVANKADKTVATSTADGLMSKEMFSVVNNLGATLSNYIPTIGGEIDGNLEVTGDLDIGGDVDVTGTVTIKAPTSDLHAATKKYVDDGLANKASTAIATTTTAGLMSADDKEKLDVLDELLAPDWSGYAELAGATFTGAVSFNDQVNFGDTTFHTGFSVESGQQMSFGSWAQLGINGTNMDLMGGEGAVLRFNRTSLAWSFYTGGVQQTTIDSTGITTAASGKLIGTSSKSQTIEMGLVPNPTVLTGTPITPSAANNNWFIYTNSGGFTLNIPPNNGSYTIAVTNAASGAGALIASSSFSKVYGTFKTTANLRQWLRIERIESHITLYIEEA